MNQMNQTEYPIITADVVVHRPDRSILLIQRVTPPFQGYWALPGGKLNKQETVEACAVRELAEETLIRVKSAHLRLINVYSDPGRDPRGRYISIAYLVNVPQDTIAVGRDDAKNATWFPIDALPGKLAFDHELIIGHARSLMKAIRILLGNYDCEHTLSMASDEK